MTPLEVVQAQLDAYNAQDLDRFCGWYAEDCVLADLNGIVTLEGRAALRARFAKTFADYPQNRAWSQNRISVGNVVVDHEVGERSPGGERFEIVATYIVRDACIVRLAMGK